MKLLAEIFPHRGDRSFDNVQRLHVYIEEIVNLVNGYMWVIACNRYVYPKQKALES